MNTLHNLTGITLTTPRLILRDLEVTDMQPIVAALNNYEVSRSLLRPPLPYQDADALSYIHTAQEGRKSGYWLPCAIVLRREHTFIGTIGITGNDEYQRGDVGYWLDEAHWGQGYMTEALRAIIQFGFEHWDLMRIAANHFTDNPASGRVMQKAGMTYEGTLRRYFMRFGEPKDAAFYSILRDEWQGGQPG